MKRWMIVLGIVIVLLIALILVFYNTGGRGLSRIIRPYLMADIPDKRYGWSDFIPNKDTKRVSGFYSSQFSNDETVAIWTFAGLQRFRHQPGTSVYYYRDVCAQIKAIKEGGSEGSKAIPSREVAYFDIPSWQVYMQSEYLVTLQWVEVEGSRVVDKLWSVSGRYRVLGQVGGSVCE